MHGAAEGLNYLHGEGLAHGRLHEVCITSPSYRSYPDIIQANVLITSDTPPRACLADSGFLTVVVDPDGPTPCSTQSDGAEAFMSPELLIPSMFGVKDSTPTMEADIYAFGLLIFQVNELNNGYPRFF